MRGKQLTVASKQAGKFIARLTLILVRYLTRVKLRQVIEDSLTDGKVRRRLRSSNFLRPSPRDPRLNADKENTLPLLRYAVIRSVQDGAVNIVPQAGNRRGYSLLEGSR
jgi:hypothetical protein